jgi:Zn-dependent protease
MDRLHVYHGSLAVVGLCLFVPAARSVAAGEVGLPTLLATAGGGGLVVAALYESMRADPEAFRPSAARLLLVVGAACLAVLGTALAPR